ncbi:hypothetical protein [Algoriphagus sp. A40]|uniref:hypothetical protein n=1 Tax=Algoriphagus sp. A40 TaxID=1945863 RepID=UPI000986FF1B|nr:hypothetical protein [Algoriphagus sp. A40]OOG75341.1 hypothetical protein B0E43_10185 [Algoriphagus sp. A40]
MKTPLYFLLLATVLIACTASHKEVSPKNELTLTGTWKLISGATIRGADTTLVDYTQGQSFIKIINKSHFSFFRHDLNKGQDSTAVFSAGAGTYTLVGNTYKEHLEYFNLREWEGHDFEFTVSIEQDTLIQTGIEKIVELGVDQIIIEKYVKQR